MNLVNKLEALLFVSGNNGIELKTLAKLLEIPTKQVKLLLGELATKFHNDSPLILEQFGNTFKLATKLEYNELLSKFIDNKPNKLSQSSLETLAIIAYKGPITKIEVESIRGIDSTFTFSKLVALDLIQEIERAQTPGAPILYGVSKKFMDNFKIKDLSQLPNLEEILDKVKSEENIYKSNYHEQT